MYESNPSADMIWVLRYLCIMSETMVQPLLTAKDFATDQEVRWCPGCGDYSILAQVQKVMPSLGIPRENIVFISGIGCSSRFPYYMNTFGMHSIHGRATAIASGLKASRPELSVWIITGDGDSLSIGGNHTIHLLRRNFDVNILMFNNQIYGLTKGQYSPTSEEHKITKSTPMGSIDHPFNPAALALGADATFVARSMDRDPKHLQAMLLRAHGHKGSSFLEIYQNCNIFNDGAYKGITEKELRDDRVLYLEHGKPLLFGKDKDKGIAFDEAFRPRVVTGAELSKAFVWDETADSPAPAMALANMDEEHFPVPLGVFRRRELPTFESGIRAQVDAAKQKKQQSLHDLLRQGEIWEVS